MTRGGELRELLFGRKRRERESYDLADNGKGGGGRGILCARAEGQPDEPVPPRTSAHSNAPHQYFIADIPHVNSRRFYDNVIPTAGGDNDDAVLLPPQHAQVVCKTRTTD